MKKFIKDVKNILDNWAYSTIKDISAIEENDNSFYVYRVGIYIGEILKLCGKSGVFLSGVHAIFDKWQEEFRKESIHLFEKDDSDKMIQEIKTQLML